MFCICSIEGSSKASFSKHPFFLSFIYTSCFQVLWTTELFTHDEVEYFTLSLQVNYAQATQQKSTNTNTMNFFRIENLYK